MRREIEGEVHYVGDITPTMSGRAKRPLVVEVGGVEEEIIFVADTAKDLERLTEGIRPNDRIRAILRGRLVIMAETDGSPAWIYRIPPRRGAITPLALALRLQRLAGTTSVKEKSIEEIKEIATEIQKALTEYTKILEEKQREEEQKKKDVEGLL